MDWTEEKIVEIFKQVEEKSKTDREFRDSLIDNPNEAIKTLTGLDVPKELKLNFTEQKLWERTIILPAYEGDELADDQLENVAGGQAKPRPGGGPQPVITPRPGGPTLGPGLPPGKVRRN